MFNPVDLSRIDRQIEDLQRLKASYQNMGQPPINNIIATQPQMPTQQMQSMQEKRPIFEARFTTENPADTFVQNKTAFINLKNNILIIKEVDGDTKEYVIIPPKDEKDLRIQQLENEINILKENYMSLQSSTINNLQNGVPLQQTQIPQPQPQQTQVSINNVTPSEPTPIQNQSNMALEPIIFEQSKNNYTVSEQTSLTDKIKSKFKKQ